MGDKPQRSYEWRLRRIIVTYKTQPCLTFTHFLSPPPQPPSSSPPQQSSSSSSSIKPMMISPLYKQHSWSPDAYRDEAWLRRKGNHRRRTGTGARAWVSDFELIDSPDHVVDQRLSDTLPALGLYYAVNKHYNDTVSNSKSTLTPCSSPLGSPHHTLLGPGDNPQTVKTRLRRWAQVVACSVRQSSG
ncbi:hypothetical protein RGQ29_022385 [Quercus rubra]|uniref:Uncharacterized protein n=1 Tax=Quercus rubra TaxID=3512 RepID=A0AAN7F2A3_QUERU|nr:hypothetical protein RGQ29_022385 [Quercus rubra]